MGSAAAEGWPAIWCKCKSCQRARAAGGKNIRTRSSALVDGVIKLDLPADYYMQSLRDNLDLSNMTDLLVSHSHADHLVPPELSFHRPPFAHDTLTLNVWGGQTVIDRVRNSTGNWPDRDERLHVVEAFVPFVLNDGTRVVPLPAAHDKGSTPFNYIITRGGKTLFYGMDSGWYPDESWAAHAGHKFDIVVIDCTLGDPGHTWWGHGTLTEAIKIKERMLAEGTAHADTVFVANHFSHNGGMLQAEMEERVAGTGILIGYDGMVVEV